MDSSVPSVANVTNSFLKALKMQSSPATRSGRNTSLKPSRAIQIGVRPSLRHTNRGPTGKSGSLPWLPPPSIHGHCTLFGNFYITIPARCHSSQTIRSRMRHLITFGRDSIVINSLQSARKRGGNANQLANGYPRSRRTVPSFVVCSKRWIGWTERWDSDNFHQPRELSGPTDGTHEEACSGDWWGGSETDL